VRRRGSAKWDLLHRDKKLARGKQRYQEKKEEICAAARQWNKDNPELASMRRRQKYLRNKIAELETQRKRYAIQRADRLAFLKLLKDIETMENDCDNT
jgi:hypothetical protein